MKQSSVAADRVQKEESKVWRLNVAGRFQKKCCNLEEESAFVSVYVCAWVLVLQLGLIESNSRRLCLLHLPNSKSEYLPTFRHDWYTGLVRCVA